MDKTVAKRYLISVTALYFLGVLFITLLLLAMTRSQADVFGKVNITPLAALGIGLVCSLLPAGSYTGFVLLGLRVKELDAKKGILMIAFFPLLLVFVTLYGIVMLLPGAVRALLILVRK